MRRFVVISAMVCLWLAVATGVATADDDLDLFLERADAAGYSGVQFVVTVWDDDTVSGVFELEQAGERVMVQQGDGESLISDGKVLGMGDAGGLAIGSWSEGVLGSRYRVGSVGAGERYDRPSETVEIFEGDLLRARLVFDVKTGAPVAAEVYDSAGELFRFAAMLSFDPSMDGLSGMPAGEPDYEVVLSRVSTTLPASVAGYTRVDVYDAPGGGVHAFYADGLFSFSIFELPKDAGDGRFRDADTVEMNDRPYRRLLTPSDVWLMWRSSDATLVLVGDLPPDHLASVLEGLPGPERRGFFSRLWGGIFG